jgi:hypothetical protein
VNTDRRRSKRFRELREGEDDGGLAGLYILRELASREVSEMSSAATGMADSTRVLYALEPCL